MADDDLPPIARPPRPRGDGDWNADRFELFKWFDLLWRHLGGTTTSSSNPPVPPVVVPPIVIIPDPAYPEIIIPVTVVSQASASYTVNPDVDTTIIADCFLYPTTIQLPTMVGYVSELCIKHSGVFNFIIVLPFSGELIENTISFILYPGESINIRPIDNNWWVV
jgi:hypothetical protein